MEVEPAGGFTFLGPGIGVKDCVMRDGPAASLYFVQRQAPEIQKFSADPECIGGYREILFGILAKARI